MVCLDKHPWFGTLRYNQLELPGCRFLLPTIDSSHHQLDERQTHRMLKEHFRIQAFGIQLMAMEPYNNNQEAMEQSNNKIKEKEREKKIKKKNK